jgi:hypothetical protein
MALTHDKEDTNKHIQHVDQTPTLMNIRFLGYNAQNFRGSKEAQTKLLGHFVVPCTPPEYRQVSLHY